MLANRTIMSLDQRFTRLRRGESRVQQIRGGGVASGRIDLRSGGGASFKNRRLAMEMSKRPAVLAALARNNFQDLSNGLGFNTSIRMRRSSSLGRGRGGLGRGGLRRSGSLSSLGGLSPGVFRGGGLGLGGRGRSLKRSGSLSKLSRSQSLLSLNGTGASNFRGRLGVRGRGRFRRGGAGGRLSRASSLQSLNALNGGFRSRGRGGRRSMSVTRGFADRRNQLRQQRGRGVGGSGVRGRGRGRGGRNLSNSGRGRGRGGGRRGRGRGGGDQWSKGPPPSKDVLDKELDQYMASTKVSLDKELDSYMNQAEEKWD